MMCACGFGPASQVTDRLATAGLLMVLSKEYPAYFFHCMGLVLLDIGGAHGLIHTVAAAQDEFERHV